MDRSQKRGEGLVDELGIPIRLHYHVIGAFLTATALAPLLLSFTPDGAPLANSNIRVITAITVVAGPFLVLYGRRTGYRWQKRTYHVAIGLGNLLLAYGALNTGSLRGALLASMVVPALTSAYFLPPRHALPHVVIGTAAIITTAAFSNELNDGLHATVMGFVVFAGSIMVMMIKRQVASALAENRHYSETDPLTGVANLHRLETRLEDDLSCFALAGESFALIELDLDEFKEVNDRYSHTIGDHALIGTADAIRATTTPQDLVVRRGGDEFVVVAPQIAGRRPEDLVARIGEAIASARKSLCPEIMSTVSIGYALPAVGDSPADLIARADAVLHAAKAASREARRKSEPPARIHGRREPPIPISARSGPHRQQALRWAGNASRIRSDNAPRDPIQAATAFAWRGASMLTIAGCAVIVGPGLVGIADVPLSTIPILLVAIAVGGFAPVLWLMSKRDTQSVVMGGLLVYGTIALLTVAGLATPSIALAIIDLLLIVTFVQTYLLPGRLAIVSGLVTGALYFAFMVKQGYAQPLMRFGSTGTTAVTISSLLALARQRTVELARQNESMAHTDALTGLANLRRLRDRLRDEIHRCDVSGDGFAMLMVDLDDFKSANDLYSHSVGDQVIVAVARTIERSIRWSDMPARRGGDEFAVVLADINAAETAATVDRIADAISAARLGICPDITPTASVGAVVWKPGEDVDQLITRADEELHETRATARSTRGAAARAVHAGPLSA